MSRLIESVKLLDGKFYNLAAHEQRMAASLHALYGSCDAIGLERYLRGFAYPHQGLYKCRIVYDNIDREVTFDLYEARKVNRVKLVEDNAVSYPFKFVDRANIDRLFGQRGDCDDVLIVKDGWVTDCSFSNIAFGKGGEWFTPRWPLLKGTMRQKLIAENKIQPREILAQDIRSFNTFKIMNAMLEFDSPEIEVSDIVF